jgi:hypothetical protein
LIAEVRRVSLTEQRLQRPSRDDLEANATARGVVHRDRKWITM